LLTTPPQRAVPWRQGAARAGAVPYGRRESKKERERDIERERESGRERLREREKERERIEEGKSPIFIQSRER